MVTRLKKHDVIRWRQETPNGKCVYSVNPKYLDKTGVITHIPVPKKPKSPIVIPPVVPTLAVDKEELRKQVVAFIEEDTETHTDQTKPVQTSPEDDQFEFNQTETDDENKPF